MKTDRTIRGPISAGKRFLIKFASNAQKIATTIVQEGLTRAVVDEYADFNWATYDKYISAAIGTRRAVAKVLTRNS